MHATLTIPIVVASSADPVQGGIVSTLARPGGNVTGNSMMHTDTSVKRLQLLKEAVPTVRVSPYSGIRQRHSTGPC